MSARQFTSLEDMIGAVAGRVKGRVWDAHELLSSAERACAETRIRPSKFSYHAVVQRDANVSCCRHIRK